MFAEPAVRVRGAMKRLLAHLRLRVAARGLRDVAQHARASR